ncbi:hypothetical protein ACJ41O_002328 [Fusarium nematophilum]
MLGSSSSHSQVKRNGQLPALQAKHPSPFLTLLNPSPATSGTIARLALLTAPTARSALAAIALSPNPFQSLSHATAVVTMELQIGRHLDARLAAANLVPSLLPVALEARGVPEGKVALEVLVVKEELAVKEGKGVLAGLKVPAALEEPVVTEELAVKEDRAELVVKAERVAREAPGVREELVVKGELVDRRALATPMRLLRPRIRL